MKKINYRAFYTIFGQPDKNGKIPVYSNIPPEPKSPKAEAITILEVIADAIKDGGYTFTSKNSIRIYKLNRTPHEMTIGNIEVEWKANL